MASFTSFNLAKQLLTSVPKLARSYATPASTKTVKVPLTLYGIEGRYATALFGAASKQQTLEKVETELNKIKTVIDKDSIIRNFLEDPSLSRQVKKTVLAENGRLGITTKIINSFQSLMTANRGEVPVTIVSVKELDSNILRRLEKSLAKFLDPGQKLIVTNKVNPSILGGLVVEIGNDKTIDLSVSSKLAKLNKLLTDAV
ncbi:ATP synthase subunit O, mitochondrial [Rhizophagus clarus]|uniref:ATP synthase subunit 5, mitochondrial n=1 Tax=Rhizophagus clarus TaxID=94130 RepID=A0A8H3LH91_9GLOM|nr:ATP synthase subunit O, mitochondrial [Rhizophagus clarus]